MSWKILPNRAALDMGIVQEINRLVLHPRGLVLVVDYDSKDDSIGQMHIGKEDDPSGIVFSDLTDEESARKAENFKKLLEKNVGHRAKALGWVIQPVPSKV